MDCSGCFLPSYVWRHLLYFVTTRVLDASGVSRGMTVLLKLCDLLFYPIPQNMPGSSKHVLYEHPESSHQILAAIMRGFGYWEWHRWVLPGCFALE